MAKTVVLYPGLAVSHFVPMMQLAGAFLEHGYAVSVALIDPSVKGDIAWAAVVARVAASMPSVRFHTLSSVEGLPKLTHHAHFFPWYHDLLLRYNERLHDFLCSIGPRRVHAVVVDSMSSEALGVPKRLGIGAYNLFTCSASILAAFAQLPTLLPEGGTSFGELGGTPLELFGIPPMPASHLPSEVLGDRDSEAYKATMTSLCRIMEADGTLVNTFESLEARAVAALRDPRCVPGRVLPPVYCVGPFVGTSIAEAKERHECLAWLDGQPERSVVFLCFGSIGRGNHSEEQLREIALGLEKSGHRFLWVVRAPVSDDPEKPFDPRADPNLGALLPRGFLERTKGRGLVVKLWAPQAEVLRHNATGAFVTHCGWNSVLESITVGVPMLSWPLYAEQKMNKVLMVGDMGIAAEIVGWQQGLVKAGEVESKVRLVMESEEGRELRAWVAAHKEGAAAACNDGGSSRLALAQFLADVASRQDRACSDE